MANGLAYFRRDYAYFQEIVYYFGLFSDGNSYFYVALLKTTCQSQPAGICSIIVLFGHLFKRDLTTGHFFRFRACWKNRWFFFAPYILFSVRLFDFAALPKNLRKISQRGYEQVALLWHYGKREPCGRHKPKYL